MKYFIIFVVLLASCSESTTPSPYSPGGIFYMKPGTFVGTWRLIVNRVFTDTNFCIASITEADSLVVGEITDTNTHEVLNIRGRHVDIAFDPSGSPNTHDYGFQYRTSLGDTGSDGELSFLAGDGLSLSCHVTDSQAILIFGYRQ